MESVLNLNLSELIVGFCYPLAFVFWIKWWVILACPASSYLWALTGFGGSKLYRRLGCPMIVATSIFINLHHWQVFIGVPISFGILSLGYGIPDSSDRGSWLGRLWYKISPAYANLLTRSTIYLLLFGTFLLLH